MSFKENCENDCCEFESATAESFNITNEDVCGADTKDTLDNTDTDNVTDDTDGTETEGGAV